MSKKRLEEIEEPFENFEKIKTHMLKRKIRDGLDEFKRNKGQQWTELRFEKPLLDKLLSSIEQAERVKELEQKVRVDSELFDKQVQQNKRYRNLLESLSKTRNIPAKIMKEQPDKKIIDANDLLQYILRKINDELERGTE